MLKKRIIFINIVVLLLLCFIISYFNSSVLANSESDFFDSIGKLHDDLYTGLGKVDYKPYMEFSTDELVNLQNGNLILKLTEEKIPGKIPLKLNRTYNSQWSKPIFQGPIDIPADDQVEVWRAADYSDQIAGMDLNIHTYIVKELDFFRDYFFAPSINSTDFLILTGQAHWALLIRGLFSLEAWFNSQKNIYSTNLLLSHPKNELVVNDLFAILPKYSRLDPNSTKDIPQFTKHTEWIGQELNLVFANGSVKTFKLNPISEEYLPEGTGSDYRIKKVTTPIGENLDAEEVGYIVFDPNGLQYYFKEYTEIFDSSNKSYSIDFPYALPERIDDLCGNQIRINRDDHPPYRITSIDDTLGQTVMIKYEKVSGGRKEILTLPDERVYGYVFDEQDDLVEIQDPLAIEDPTHKTTRLTYDTYVYKNDLIEYEKEFSHLKSYELSSGLKVEYNDIYVIHERKEYDNPGDLATYNQTQFQYVFNSEDGNPALLYQETTVIDAEGNKSKYTFRNPYEGNEEYATFPWALTNKIEGIGEYDLVTDFKWNDQRKLKEAIIRHGNQGYKTTYIYDAYGNDIEVRKNILVQLDSQYEASEVANAYPLTVVYKDYEYIVEDDAYLVNLLQYQKIENGDLDQESWYDYDLSPDTAFNTDPTLTERSSDHEKDEQIGQLTRIRRKITYLDNTGENPTSQVVIDEKLYYDEYGNMSVKINGKGDLTYIQYDDDYHMHPILETQYPDLNATDLGQDIVAMKIQSGTDFHPNKLSRSFEYYSGSGILKKETDYNGNPTTYVYDKLNRLTLKTLPDQSTEEHEYQDYDQNSSNYNLEIITYHSTNPNGQDKVLMKFTDGLGKIIEERIKVDESISSSSYAQKEYAYNGLGKQTEETDFAGNKMEYEYDSLGRLTKIINPDLTFSESHFSYQTFTIEDKKYFGLVETRFDEEKVIRKFYFNPDGKVLKRVTYHLGENEQLEEYEVGILIYDHNGNVTKVINPGQQSYFYTYNERGDLLKVQYPDQKEELYWYDAAGNLKKKISKGKEQTTYTYDSLKRMTQVRYTWTGTGQPDYLIDTAADQVTFIYDQVGDGFTNGLGNLTTISDQTGRTEYSYDEFSRIAQINRFFVDPSLTASDQAWTSGYDYNGFGQLIKIDYPSNYIVYYTYDDRGLLEKVILEDPTGSIREIADFDFNVNGLLDMTTYGQGKLSQSYGYDQRQRLTSTTVTQNQQPLFSNQYGLDRLGNVVSRTGRYGEETGFQYDELSRLTGVDYPGNEKMSYMYDPMGNREELVYQHLASEGYSYDYEYNEKNNQLDQLTVSPHLVNTYAYNPNGSLIQKELQRGGGSTTLQRSDYKYDLRNQLREVQIDNQMTGFKTMEKYEYNSNGWRVKKESDQEVTYYLYGKGIRVLEERSGFKGSAEGKLNLQTKIMIYGPQGRIAYLDEDQKLHYVINDLTGSTSIVTNEQGQELANFDYSPFGTLNQSEDQTGEMTRFTGKDFDATTGLYYMGARYYDPTLGRFISEDPIQEGWNWYTYSMNNPLKYFDPDGEDALAFDYAWSIGACFGIEGGKIYAVDTNGYFGTFKHFGGQWVTNISAGVGVNVIYSPTMEYVEKGFPGFGVAGSFSAGLGGKSVAGGAGFNTSGDILYSVGFGGGSGVLPAELSVAFDWTWKIKKEPYIKVPEHWVRYDNLELRYDQKNQAMYVRNYTLLQTFVISENKIKAYWLTGPFYGELIYNFEWGEED